MHGGSQGPFQLPAVFKASLKRSDRHSVSFSHCRHGRILVSQMVPAPNLRSVRFHLLWRRQRPFEIPSVMIQPFCQHRAGKPVCLGHGLKGMIFLSQVILAGFHCAACLGHRQRLFQIHPGIKSAQQLMPRKPVRFRHLPVIGVFLPQMIPAGIVIIHPFFQWHPPTFSYISLIVPVFRPFQFLPLLASL